MSKSFYKKLAVPSSLDGDAGDALAEGVLSLTVLKSGTCPQLFGRREIPKVRAESDYDHDHFLEGLLNLTVPKSGNCPQLFGRREIPKKGVES